MKRLLILALALFLASPAWAVESNKLYCDDEATPSYQTDGCAVTGATGIVTIPVGLNTGQRLRRATLDVRGTFASATCAVQASIDGTNFDAVTDSLGAAVSFTADDTRQVLDFDFGPWAKARVNCTGGGGGTALTVTFLGDYQ